MKLILKHKAWLYILVAILITANILMIGIRTFVATDDNAPIFVIYTQHDDENLEKLFTKIQDIKTTDTASYMYLDKENKNYGTYKNVFNLGDMDNAFIVMNRKQEILGIKTPCPDYAFIEKIIKKYDY